MKDKKPTRIQDFLKPRAGKIRQGYFKPAFPEKYIGDVSSIVFRSSWEFKFLKWCDLSDTVIRYASEPLGIIYYNPLDKRAHKYYVDFFVITKDKAGGPDQRWLIEVKPLKYVNPPVAPKIMTNNHMANYIWASKQFIINRAKFEAAKAFADQRGVRFGVVTENFLFKSI